MSRLAPFALAALAFAATATLAQEGPASPAPPPSKAQRAKEADIQRLMETMGARKITTQMFDQLLGAIRQSTPGVPPRVWDEFRQAFANDDELERIQVHVWDKYFTHEDVKGLIEFYNSPLGRKLIEQQPLVLKESMDAGQAWGIRTMERIKQKLRDKGFTVA